MMETVAILGASEKEGRYSRMAQEILMAKGYEVIPVSRKHDEVLGLKCYASLADVPQDIDTLTLYVNPKHLAVHLDAILASGIRRVIFNPGTESEDLEKQLMKSGKEVIHGCTIVMLKTGRF